jgi:hypothetical protein
MGRHFDLIVTTFILVGLFVIATLRDESARALGA